MVIIVDGTPIASKKVVASPRSPRCDALLPTIPSHGPAALLSADVLVSRVEEISWAGNGPQGQRRRQQRLPISTTALRQSQQPSPKTIFQHGSIVHKLHKTDHAHAPRFLDSLLVTCHNESCASLPVDKGRELALSHKLDDELISNATFETNLKGAAFDDHHNVSPSPVTSPRITKATEQTVRSNHLRDSFRISLKDIADRLTEIEKHSHVSAAIAASYSPEKQSEKLVNDLFYSQRASLFYRQDRGGLSEDVNIALPQILRAFECSAIGFMIPKPMKENRSIGKDEMGLTVTSASMEEVTLATDLLNFLRWLCGLGPVSLNENCIRACQAVAQALLPRSALFLKPSSTQFASVSTFASLLAEFVSSKCRCIILHGEGSLFEAVLQCLLTCAAPVDAVTTSSTSQKPGRDRDDLVYNACRRAEHYHNKEARCESDKAQPPLLLTQTARQVVDLKSLPNAMAEFHLLWLLAETCLADFRRSSRVPKPHRAHCHRSKDQRRARKTPRQPQRTRAIAWSQEQEMKEQAKTAVFWGDRDERILFRRYLLNPALESFGASRGNDTCAFWSAAEKVPFGVGKKHNRQPGTSSPRPQPQEYPETSRDIVCFPPPGYFPHEFLLGTVPTWTIMPNSQIYQPTHSLSVRMWRVRIEESSAERIGEVAMSSFFCDCSARGNPFCIFFQPELERIADGDQFEVELNGLRGCDTKLHIFHEFRTFHSEHLDAELFNAVRKFCAMLESKDFWQEPQKTVVGNDAEPPRRSSVMKTGARAALFAKNTLASIDTTFTKDAVGNSSLFSPTRSSPQSPLSIRAESPPKKLPDIGLITHPSLSFTTEVVDICMSVRCVGAVALKVHLKLVRASGNEEVRHATWVMKCAENFVVKVKLPMSQCRYELIFKVSLPSAPSIMLDHPLKYSIFASEACQNLLIAMDHPFMDKFGYGFQSPLAQIHGISVIAPFLYRVKPGYMYFLVHVGPEAYRQHGLQRSSARCQTSLFSSRLAPDESNIAPTPQQEKLARAGCPSSSEIAACVVTAFQKILKPALEPMVQDSQNAIHIDVSVLQKTTMGGSLGQRYVKRLQRRTDFPEFYHGLLWFSESEADCVVEMFLRFPTAQAAQYAPVKIGEWRITHTEEEFPIGF